MESSSSIFGVDFIKKIAKMGGKAQDKFT